MYQKIEHITTSVKYGPHLNTSEEGKIKYLKANHFDEDGQLNNFSDSYVDEAEINQSVLLEEGDIILAAKGFRHFAWVYEAKYGACVASSLFYVLKPKGETVLSKYLCLCMNASHFQYQLKLIGLGVTTPSIPKNELLRLKIPLLPLAQQQQLIEMDDLLTQQIEIEKRIIAQKKLLKSGLLNMFETKNKP